MKIILVATDTRAKSLVFVSDTLKVFSLKQVFDLIHSGVLKDVYIVQSQYGNYIRSAPNIATMDNLDTLSVSGPNIISFINQTSHAKSTPPISDYMRRYLASLKEGEPFLTPVGQNKVLVADIKNKFTEHLSLISTAAKEFSADKYLLGAIIIDELARMHPFEPIINKLEAKIVGMNVSIGIAQVKIDTANQLIKKGLYNPNPGDKKLPFNGTLSNDDRKYLYEYVIQPKYNVRFAAAFIRSLINDWMDEIDLSQRPEIVATLYHLPYRPPRSKPVSDERGDQIASEFYKLAKKWLK